MRFSLSVSGWNITASRSCSVSSLALPVGCAERTSAGPSFHHREGEGDEADVLLARPPKRQSTCNTSLRDSQRCPGSPCPLLRYVNMFPCIANRTYVHPKPLRMSCGMSSAELPYRTSFSLPQAGPPDLLHTPAKSRPTDFPSDSPKPLHAA
jgi:hypothetical protein